METYFVIYPGESSLCTWVECMFCCVCGEVFCRWLLSPVVLCFSSLLFPCWSALVDYWKWSTAVFNIIVELYICFSFIFCFSFFWVLLRAYLFLIFKSYWWICHYNMFFFVPSNNICLKAYFFWLVWPLQLHFGYSFYGTYFYIFLVLSYFCFWI